MEASQQALNDDVVKFSTTSLKEVSLMKAI
jgi:hypothetical protein